MSVRDWEFKELVGENYVTINLPRHGWVKFLYPYHCLCCSEEIDERQFRFSTLCGLCDTGKCTNFSKGGVWYGGHNKSEEMIRLWGKKVRQK